MNLHHNRDEFIAAISEAAQKLDLPEHVLEKDYWVTMLLKKTSEFIYRDYVVFKGGTSLSKGFDLILSEIYSDPIKLLKPIESDYDNLRSVTFDRKLPHLEAICNTLKSIGTLLEEFKFEE